ncbi:rhodanese-like domain-containing protein [Actinocrinis puniceicyclus]|uniref:Rhodanese-like domain-containing protein n=1 Tax=Actinocrinis puniceicyclus TaxID=977794 RepID=A0A8J8BCP6_9ACTN|nr:rhodanese-like domain-containing protein [Actinocrinis puniceicyclus]MBS2965332.1 rhodanese-like domain-containing protein [Actinocrinis puniceicyclus]
MDTPRGIYEGGGMVREVDVHELAAAQRDGAFVLDVRESFEYADGHVPGAVLVPLGSVRGRISELPRDRRIYVICASGNRSYTAAGWLTAAGLDACSVRGGTGAWIRAGQAAVTGLRERAA